MKLTLLMIRGCPGSGKITVARLLAERLGWKLFWLHDLDPIFRLVEDHRDATFIDNLTAPILRKLLRANDKLIYVRPARCRDSVDMVVDLTDKSGHDLKIFRLTASQETLDERVNTRDPQSEFRIGDSSDLAEYVNARLEEPYYGEIVITTDGFTPEQVADSIQMILGVARSEPALSTSEHGS
jgi:cytidylate kinase